MIILLHFRNIELFHILLQLHIIYTQYLNTSTIGNFHSHILYDFINSFNKDTFNNIHFNYILSYVNLTNYRDMLAI